MLNTVNTTGKPIHFTKYQSIRKFVQVHRGKHLGPCTFIWITTKSATQVVQNRGFHCICMLLGNQIFDLK